MRNTHLSFFVFLFVLFTLPLPIQAEDLNTAGMIEKIETRRGTWTGFEAELSMNFKNLDGHQASCRGKLLYNRLDEKILMTCSKEEKPLFYFKTDDTQFQLFLVGQNTVYQGSIFDLSGSPNLQSHLRALDLYRALKPQGLRPEETVLTQEGGKVLLKVAKDGAPEREMVANEKGDVLEEVYKDVAGKILEKIARGDFQDIQGTKPQSVYPAHITLYSNAETMGQEGFNETELIFENVKFYSNPDSSKFEIPLPENIRKLTL